jgi:hypothetical protein
LVPAARQLPQLEYEEMLELAAAGAKVLHFALCGSTRVVRACRWLSGHRFHSTQERASSRENRCSRKEMPWSSQSSLELLFDLSDAKVTISVGAG